MTNKMKKQLSELTINWTTVTVNRDTGIRFTVDSGIPEYVSNAPHGYRLGLTRDSIQASSDEELLELIRWFRDEGGELGKQKDKQAKNERKDDCFAGDKRLREAQSESGWIYILEGLNAYKIGFTRLTPDERLCNISPRMPFDIKLWHSFPADDPKQAEAILHEHYKTKRIKGEWFNLKKDDLMIIKGYMAFGEGLFI